MKNYKKLKIWQKGMELVMLSYELANELPVEQRFGLRSQITRAAVSIPSNIAEGSAKRSMKEYIKFLETSLGSAYELETQVLIADQLKFGSDKVKEQLLISIDEEQKMLRSFIVTVERE